MTKMIKIIHSKNITIGCVYYRGHNRIDMRYYNRCLSSLPDVMESYRTDGRSSQPRVDLNNLLALRPPKLFVVIFTGWSSIQYQLLFIILFNLCKSSTLVEEIF